MDRRHFIAGGGLHAPRIAHAVSSKLLRQHEDDPRSLDIIRGPTTVLDDSIKPGAIARREQKPESLSHAKRLAQTHSPRETSVRASAPGACPINDFWTATSRLPEGERQDPLGSFSALAIPIL